MTERALHCVLAGLFAACGNSPAPPPTATPVAPRVQRTGPFVPLTDFAELFGVEKADTLSAVHDAAGLRAWIRAQLQEDAFYDSFVPQLFPSYGDLWKGILTRVGLREGKSKAKGTFYYRFEPCADKDLVSVQPWWAPKTTILVCSEDYRPTVLVGTTGQSCDVSWGPLLRSTGCGCGPHLMFCGTDQQNMRTFQATESEFVRTIGYVIKSNRPFGDILKMNETVRNGYAQLLQSRVEYFLHRKFQFPDLDPEPSLRPRPAVFEGGVLSTPAILFGDGPRTQTATVWKEFLCVPFLSVAVDTHTLLAETRDQSKDIRAEALMYLTKTTGCQNCHMKLEHGVLARGGWQPAFLGSHFVVPTRTERTHFYVRDHRDHRGEGTASLGWLGQMITSQPEFVDCMVSKVSGIVYEGQPVPQPIHNELVRRFKEGQNMARLIEDTVVVRAFGARALGAKEQRR